MPKTAEGRKRENLNVNNSIVGKEDLNVNNNSGQEKRRNAENSSGENRRQTHLQNKHTQALTSLTLET